MLRLYSWTHEELMGSQLLFPLSSRPKPKRGAASETSGGIPTPLPDHADSGSSHQNQSLPPSSAHSIEREVLFFPANCFFFVPDHRFLSRSTASLLWYPFCDRPRERMRLRARAKWVPTHGYDWKKKQATQSRRIATKTLDEHMGNKTHYPQNKIVIPTPQESAREQDGDILRLPTEQRLNTSRVQMTPVQKSRISCPVGQHLLTYSQLLIALIGRGEDLCRKKMGF
jgi:hypothetical protein